LRTVRVVVANLLLHRGEGGGGGCAGLCRLALEGVDFSGLLGDEAFEGEGGHGGDDFVGGQVGGGGPPRSPARPCAPWLP